MGRENTVLLQFIGIQPALDCNTPTVESNTGNITVSQLNCR